MSLLLELRKILAGAAVASKAPQMQAYMKSEMPYHGVQSPALKRICKDFFKDAEFPDAKSWQAAVLGLWRPARFREERYAALHLCGHRSAREYQTPEAMKLYEELIVTGAWWDYVDDIASHRVGPILRDHPGPMKRKMLSWSRSSNLWKRRTSIICQLGFKGETDLELLYACIEPSLGSKEFFLQKAIGWALREYAWRDPAEVRRYVKKCGDRMAPLSRREALKNVERL